MRFHGGGHAFQLCFQGGPFAMLLFIAVEEMEIAGVLIRLIELLFHSHAGHVVGFDPHASIVFKAPPMRHKQFLNEFGSALEHNDEVIAVLIHVGEVMATEVATVQNEADFAVAIGIGLIQHELQLGHVHDAAGVLLVKEQNLVVCVITPIPGNLVIYAPKWRIAETNSCSSMEKASRIFFCFLVSG